MNSETIKEIPELFKYKRPELPSDCVFSISPSQIEKFFTYPSIWYMEQVLGTTATFLGNTATVTGTICHHIYKSVTEKIVVTREDINKQLLEYHSMKPELELDVNQIMIDYPLVTSVVVNDYTIPADTVNKLIKCEHNVIGKVSEGIYIGGSTDRIEGDCIVDYKTVSKLPNQDKIPFGYKIQLLAYAYAARKMGFEINRIRIVYGIKPTVKLPARCVVVTEEIDFIADKLINDTLQLIGETVLMAKDNPKIVHLLFKSLDLKQIKEITNVSY